MDVGARFNVLVGGSFLHTATAPVFNHTFIDNPLSNGRPDAKLLVTQNWNPNGVYNPAPAGVWYNGGHWEIFNEDLTSMPSNASFNVRVFTQPLITSQPASVTVTTSQQATLSVVVNGSPAPSYQWYQGATGNTTFPVGTGSNTFTTPPMAAQTSYWVRVTNVMGSADSTTATVSVTAGCVAPTIQAQPQSQTISSGQSATLAVVANGTSPLLYQWYQGAAGDMSHAVLGGNSSTFTTAALTSTTSYWVYMTDACGEASSNTATVTVNGAGLAITKITSKKGKPGSSAMISGAGFSTNKTQDVVYFGTSKAKVSKATSTSLKVKIPKQVEKGTVGVRVIVNGVSSNTVFFQVK